jgi:hypothetical protein
MNLNSREIQKILDRIVITTSAYTEKNGGIHPMFVLFKKGKEIIIPESYKKLPVTTITDSRVLNNMSPVMGGASDDYVAEDGATIFSAYITVTFTTPEYKIAVDKIFQELTKIHKPDMVVFLMTAYYREDKKINPKLPVPIDPKSLEAIFFMVCYPGDEKTAVMYKPMLRLVSVDAMDKQDDSFEYKEERLVCYTIDSSWTTDLSKVEMPVNHPYTGKKIS